MPFGKHRGKPVVSILKCDPSYLAWFCGHRRQHREAGGRRGGSPLTAQAEQR